MLNRSFQRFLRGCGPAALSLLVCLATFTGWAQNVADFPRQVQPLLIGTPIPKLVLKTDLGEDFNLNQAVSKKPTLLIFYRGGW